MSEFCYQSESVFAGHMYAANFFVILFNNEFYGI